MSSDHKIMNIIIPGNFTGKLTEFLEKVDSDEEFKVIIDSKRNKDGSKDRRIKKGRLDSLKVRFAMAYYLTHKQDGHA